MVTAVSNGAVVYRRDPVHHHHQLLLSPYSAGVCVWLCALLLLPWFCCSIWIYTYILHFVGAVVETPRRLYRKILDARTAAGDKSQDDMAIGDVGRSARRNMSQAMSALVSPRVTLAPGTVRSSCHGQESSSSPKVSAGWPLLKKDSMPALPELSEVSVVEWAMQLPTRCCSDQRSDEKQVQEELASLRDKYSSKYTVFRHSELARITNGFSPGTDRTSPLQCPRNLGKKELVFR
jgi:hypothetical protein